jgi:hypothetical protein
MSHVIVEFLESKTVEVIPLCWIEGETCRFPQKTQVSNIRKTIKKAKSAQDTWPVYSIKILKTYGKIIYILTLN